MRKEVEQLYTYYLNTLTLSDLQYIYDEALDDLEETERIQRSFIGVTEQQKRDYETLKDEISIYSLLESRAEQILFSYTDK